MKKLLLVLLSLVLCVGLCGCGDSSISNAKKSVDGMLSSLKSGEYDKMVSYMNTGALSLEESLDDMSKEMLDILFSKFDYKIIDATKVSDEEANIDLYDEDEYFEKDKNNIVKSNAVDLASIPYELPPLYLLKEATDNGANAINEEVAKEKAAILMEKMRELNVNATINAFVVGPAVTRFEIALAPGVRVGSFTNLQEDFKLALGVNSIRIESPIPGKSAIGIEVPNKERAMVSMKEIITQMPNKKHKLYVPVGKDIAETTKEMLAELVDDESCMISIYYGADVSEEDAEKLTAEVNLDENGEFVFGPLCPGKKYAIQIWKDDVKHIKVCAKCHIDKSPIIWYNILYEREVRLNEILLYLLG